MTSKLIIVLTAMLCVACSKNDIPTDSPPSVPASQSAVATPAKSSEFTPICEHLISLAPEKRKAELSANCQADYAKMLQSCQNPEAVSACYSKTKAWNDRLACMEICGRK